MTEVYAPLDVLGSTIKVGHLVVYPVRRRSRLTLEKARVVAITSNEIQGTKENGRRVALIHPERVVIARGR
jgi:hypothetical protein